jgi:signal transduction histidine kinase
MTLPLMVDGGQVGTLLATEAGRGSRAAEQYLDSVNQAIVLAGIAAIFIALLLGIVLAQRLTRPLRQLANATQAVAAGDFSQQVPVNSIDEIGELAQDFNQMADALQLAEKQRQQLLADTAHDLRTPISIMRSHLEAMLDGVFAPTPENLAVVHEETLHLSRLIDDVRTLSLVETGHLPLNLALVDTNDLTEQVVAAFMPLAEADGVRLEMRLKKTEAIMADAARIHQVLANLIANALRYAPQGDSTAPTVLVTVENDGNMVRFRIKDNGPGLSNEQKGQIFDRFWRSDAARGRDEGGSGLGLAIARGIVEAHKGTISVSSELGQGTEMSVLLPTADRGEGSSQL